MDKQKRGQKIVRTLIDEGFSERVDRRSLRHVIIRALQISDRSAVRGWMDYLEAMGWILPVIKGEVWSVAAPVTVRIDPPQAEGGVPSLRAEDGRPHLQLRQGLVCLHGLSASVERGATHVEASMAADGVGLRYYFAVMPHYVESLWDIGVRRILLSYEAIRGGGTRLRSFKRAIQLGFDIFLDSGAFVFWTRGVHIQLAHYASFCEEWGDQVTAYANLDVIGDPKATMENQKLMEDRGLDPIPAYHYGSPEGEWTDICASYPYAAVGGVDRMFRQQQGKQHGLAKPIPTPNPQVHSALRRTFDIAQDHGTKVHGFSFTASDLLLLYPFYSVDSTSWSASVRHRKVPMLVRRPGRNALRLKKLRDFQGGAAVADLDWQTIQESSVKHILTFLERLEESPPSRYWDDE